jgi:hypothetical protein
LAAAFIGVSVMNNIQDQADAGGVCVSLASACSTGEGFRPVAAVVGASDGGRSSFPNPDVDGLSVPPASDSTGLARLQPASGVGRSELDDWRTALHEAGHVVVGKAIGLEVAGCTIVPGDGFGGLTWGPFFDRTMLSFDNDVPDLCEKIADLMPGPGEPRADVADVYEHVHSRVVDLCAGTAAETLLHPACAPWIAHSDVRKARATASIICSSDSAVDAYLAFGLAEAKALIEQHRAAVWAIAEALMVERTLNSEQIDTIIANAPVFARRAAWIGVLENAATFTAEYKD